MNEYLNGKIYKLYDTTDPSLVYIGSTILELKKRLVKHEEKYRIFVKNGNKPTLNTSFCSSYTILKNNNYKIELIENYPCNSKKELRKREGQHQRKMECVNLLIAGRTSVEYFEDNREIISNKKKEKYKTDPEYRKKALERSVRQRMKNPDKIKEYQKNYREKNRENLSKYCKEYHSQKIHCDICNVTMRLDNLKKHLKTKKHLSRS